MRMVFLKLLFSFSLFFLLFDRLAAEGGLGMVDNYQQQQLYAREG
jgi:hypothetical protein